MRRRRNRPTWFPVLGTETGEGSPAGTVFSASYSIDGGTAIDTIVPAQTVDLLDDIDTSETATNQSLRDRVEGKDYAVSRIVGKVWGVMPQRVPQSTGAGAYEDVAYFITMCMALAILPVDSSGSPEGTDDDYNPLYSKNSAKSYMWRRTWTLWNNVAVPMTGASVVTPAAYTGPTGIQNCGSGLLDAGHLDCKSRRRVRKEERLFLIFTAQLNQAVSLAPDGINPVWRSSIDTTCYLQYGFDLRILGGMRKSHNKSVLT